MDVKLASGKIANHRARYRTVSAVQAQLAARGVAATDMEFLVFGDMKYVYWFEAR